ncbi:unnamed protein product [Soboliphyme baturini]|uniref:Mannosyl-glycoprotein endo-beta-N-acetylglucosaminidase n=1 Tax=Soboliphyme baturini TaxID=241478 RepID=A0A183ISV0_9BILA|nr:unnamed protein product [Soboliphyme baturini]
MFCSPSKTQELVEKLVQLAAVNRFDGWLINIENEIDAVYMENLVYFLQELTRLCKETIGTHSLVIMYDSIISSGKLEWQNELNASNKIFFDSCDGIFLNYCWDDDNLEKSAKTAGERKSDVFVGIDVFGRKTKHGPGFETKPALETVRQRQLSTALFAVGWTYERLSFEDFEYSEQR